AEVVQVVYDPAKLSYERLLEQFWLNHDPTVTNRQFCDAGSQYRPAIFYHSEEQKRLAEASKAKWEKNKPFRQPILTSIVPAGEFWPAEDYHQDYYKKNPARYRVYLTGCGRYHRPRQVVHAQDFSQACSMSMSLSSSASQIDFPLGASISAPCGHSVACGSTFSFGIRGCRSCAPRARGGSPRPCAARRIARWRG